MALMEARFKATKVGAAPRKQVNLERGKVAFRSNSSVLPDALPNEMMVLILGFLDIRALCRATQVSRTMCALSLGVSLLEVSLSATSVRSKTGRKALRTRLQHTKMLRVTNGQTGLSHSGRFCKLGAAACFGAAHVSFCGGLLDDGAQSIVSAVRSSLRMLDLTASGHLTRATLVRVFSSCRQLEELCCRGCWRITAQFADAELENVQPSSSLRLIDLSHTDTVDDDLIALLKLVPRVTDLRVNFCERLTDKWLNELPRSLLRCQRLVSHGHRHRIQFSV